MNHDKNILCVDENEDNNELLQIFFEQAGYKVTTCFTAEECLEYVKNNEFSAVVLDYKFPDRDGLEVFKEIKISNPHTPIIFFTGDARSSSRNEALAAGVNAYLVKPDDLEYIVSTVTNLIEAKYKNASL